MCPGPRLEPAAIDHCGKDGQDQTHLRLGSHPASGAASRTSAHPARARLPGHRAVLAAKVFWAGTVVVTLEVVAASTIEAGAWLAEIQIHLQMGAGVHL